MITGSNIKYLSLFELINAFVLVNSGYILKGDAGVSYNIMYRRTRARNLKKNNSQSIFLLLLPAGGLLPGAVLRTVMDFYRAHMDLHRACMDLRRARMGLHRACMDLRRARMDLHRACMDLRRARMDLHRASMDSCRARMNLHRACMDFCRVRDNLITAGNEPVQTCFTTFMRSIYKYSFKN
jgi:hypothetical protein